MNLRSPMRPRGPRIWMSGSRQLLIRSGSLTCLRVFMRQSSGSGLASRQIIEPRSVRTLTTRRGWMRNYRGLLVMVAWSALLSFTACANITVNIYFPEKDVKSAYKSLEEELLQTPKKEQQETPAESPRSYLQQGRQSLLAMIRASQLTLVTDAMAQEDLSRRITEEIKGYPEVIAAYKGVGGRRAQMDQLREQGLVGEGNDGKAVLRANPPQAGNAETVLREENRDREMIINGMAKAILKLTRQEGTSANLARVKSQASETFASIRREAAHQGWWVQQPNGTWTRK